VAKRLGFYYLDTGAIYRTLTLKVLKEKIDPHNEDLIARLAKELNISIKEDKEGKRIFLDGEDVTDDIRTPLVNKYVSIISKHPRARREMVALQRQIASRPHKIIMDGRDIGTVVMPDADFKFYLDASVKERARRRLLEIKQKDIDVTLEEIEREIENRDFIDSHREDSPLVVPPDARYIDTTNLSFNEVVDMLCRIITSGNKKGGDTADVL
jgi:cytidylate kinase